MNRIENPVEYARSVKSAMILARQVWDNRLSPEELGVTVEVFVDNFNPSLSPDPLENPRDLVKHPASGVDGRSYMAVTGSIVSRGKRPHEKIITRDELEQAYYRCLM